VRAKVTEGLSLASAGKTAVSEFFASNGGLPRSNASAGMASSLSIKGNEVSSVEVTASSAIEVTFSSNTTDLNDQTIVLTPRTVNGAVTWDCRGGTLQPKYRPSSCR
jgi:type IV pilus assembly protein PilA